MKQVPVFKMETPKPDFVGPPPPPKGAPLLPKQTLLMGNTVDANFVEFVEELPKEQV